MPRTRLARTSTGLIAGSAALAVGTLVAAGAEVMSQEALAAGQSPAAASPSAQTAQVPTAYPVPISRDALELPEGEFDPIVAPDSAVTTAIAKAIPGGKVSLQGPLTSQKPAVVTVTGGQAAGRYHAYLLTDPHRDADRSASILLVDARTGGLPAEVTEQLTEPGSRMTAHVDDVRSSSGQDLSAQLRDKLATPDGVLTAPDALATLRCDSGLDENSSAPSTCGMSPTDLPAFDVTVVPLRHGGEGEVDALVVFGYTP